MREEIRTGGVAAERLRGGEFAKHWIESKAPTVYPGTANLYAAALEDHVLPALGLFFYDQLTTLDVQKWVNTERRRGYRADTIKGWFRVLRTMTRDAMEPLGLPSGRSRRAAQRRFERASPRSSREEHCPGRRANQQRRPLRLDGTGGGWLASAARRSFAQGGDAGGDRTRSPINATPINHVVLDTCGTNSVGRVPASQAGCRGFESRVPL